MGVAVPDVPSWVVILEAAGGDPLRAQEIENEVTQRWWERWVVVRKAKAQAAKDKG